ncbi:hypothetical protein QJS04_geneDACA018797 [Acorus gramineus]|uniref:Nuclear pore complex protein NUP155 n=1 Tax=Acorus gramineus TaxID=55184 RepID=A0AAV9BLP8_ACOGR|nr:hypothetical protein QJS04_geneDACA018797 [Acorus gramineus]
MVGADIESAGLHVSECIGRDVASQLDLEEALESSRYTSHPYSSHPKEWPPLFEVSGKRELPPVLIERYNVSGGEGTALCGIFPEIRRAWASVDNSLFLWRLDEWWVLPNAFKFGAVDPIVDMVVDNERHILYARTEEMKLRVYDLGIDGDGPLKRIAEEQNFLDPKDTQYGGRRSLGSRASNQVVKPSVVLIAPLSIMESKWLHLVIVLSDGRRLYLSTSSPAGGNSGSVGSLNGPSNIHQRPCCLKIVATRPSPPLGIGSGLAFGSLSMAGRLQNEDLSLKVEAGYYSAGTLILSDSSPAAMSSLVVVNRDSSTHSSYPGNIGMGASSHALRETVSSLPIEGRMLSVADVLPSADVVAMVNSLYSDKESCMYGSIGGSWEKALGKLWAKGDLPNQHILPRRKIVVFSTMGMMEVVFNRPVDILRRLLESNGPRSLLEDFFNRFGAGEAAAMCLMLAAKLVDVEENLISNTVSEKAAEAFEDPRLVGMPRLEDTRAVSSTATTPGNFSMGQVVQEAEPVFSGAHEGLCLCTSRLLIPIWELPIMIIKGEVGSETQNRDRVIVCRLSVVAMQVLETKVRALEQFIRSRKNQKRGLYGCVAGLGDITDLILFRSDSDMGVGDQSMGRKLHGSYARTTDLGDSSYKRQRLPYSPAELAAMEVMAMDCLRRLLRRSSEALFLLQHLSQHHVTRLIQGLDTELHQKLVELTFHQFVCSEEGDQLATRLISGLVEYYIGPDGRGTVDDISAKLQEGCPSYFNESDYKYFLAVECLERAASSLDPEVKENLARDAFKFLTKIPNTVDLTSVCKRFEDLRYYEAVVRLPLQKAQAFDSIDAHRGQDALAQRQQCFEIIANALRNLKGEVGSSMRYTSSGSVLDQASRDRYICQIVQLSVQWPDKAFHEYLYREMIEMGLENELLEYGGSDLVPFLQAAGCEHVQEVHAGTTEGSMPSLIGHSEGSSHSNSFKYLGLLARYYVLKRQHILAAKILLRLAERHSSEGHNPTLEQRFQYLSNAVVQAKAASNSSTVNSSVANCNEWLDVIESKLAVLRFQMKIKEELEAMALRLGDSSDINDTPSSDPFPQGSLVADADLAMTAKNKAKELSLDLKGITQLYNDYAVPFELWEICLEMLNFANYSGDADSNFVRETWARLLDQALSRGGIAEACAVLRRVGSLLYPGDGVFLPLDTLCLQLEKAALERSISGVELVGDEIIARVLIAACKGAAEPVLRIYDQLLSNGAILPSPSLRLRLLHSVLVVLQEWAMSELAHKMGTTGTGASLVLGRTLTQRAVINQGVRDKLANAANRYMTEVRRLSLPQSQTEDVYQGFKELEEKLLIPSSF